MVFNFSCNALASHHLPFYLLLFSSLKPLPFYFKWFLLQNVLSSCILLTFAKNVWKFCSDPVIDVSQKCILLSESCKYYSLFMFWFSFLQVFCFSFFFSFLKYYSLPIRWVKCLSTKKNLHFSYLWGLFHWLKVTLLRQFSIFECYQDVTDLSLTCYFRVFSYPHCLFKKLSELVNH